jgi:hypothetical protein
MSPKTPAAVSGRGGHTRTFYVALSVGPGFDISEDACLRIMRMYNCKCAENDRWEEHDLLRKVQEAYRVVTRRGWKLDEDREGWQRSTNGGRDVPPPSGGAEGSH